MPVRCFPACPSVADFCYRWHSVCIVRSLFTPWLLSSLDRLFRRLSYFAGVSSALWRLSSFRFSDSISLPALFFRMQMRICFSVQGEARARWLTCSEPMLTVHFDMTFKSHSPREQMMTPNTHRGAHLPWCGVYCGATDHLYPGPLFICHYKFSRPFRW